MKKRVYFRKPDGDRANEAVIRPAGMAKLLLNATAMILLLLQIPSFASDCPDPLFICETERAGKFIAICSVEEEPGRRWSNIQYVFGRENEPEMVYPRDPTKGATSLFFSHEERGNDYRVTVRFSTGGYTYRVFSYSGRHEAGVTVSDSKGKVISTIGCIERPYMFPSYLQRACLRPAKPSGQGRLWG